MEERLECIIRIDDQKVAYCKSKTLVWDFKDQCFRCRKCNSTHSVKKTEKEIITFKNDVEVFRRKRTKLDDFAIISKVKRCK